MALYSFSGGVGSYAALTMDGSGNLYEQPILDSASGQGDVFKLTPSNGVWIYLSLRDFTRSEDGSEPFGQVTLDTAGMLYGTASPHG